MISADGLCCITCGQSPVFSLRSPDNSDLFLFIAINMHVCIIWVSMFMNRPFKGVYMSNLPLMCLTTFWVKGTWGRWRSLQYLVNFLIWEGNVKTYFYLILYTNDQKQPSIYHVHMVWCSCWGWCSLWSQNMHLADVGIKTAKAFKNTATICAVIFNTILHLYKTNIKYLIKMLQTVTKMFTQSSSGRRRRRRRDAAWEYCQI